MTADPSLEALKSVLKFIDARSSAILSTQILITQILDFTLTHRTDLPQEEVRKFRKNLTLKQLELERVLKPEAEESLTKEEEPRHQIDQSKF